MRAYISDTFTYGKCSIPGCEMFLSESLFKQSKAQYGMALCWKHQKEDHDCKTNIDGRCHCG